MPGYKGSALPNFQWGQLDATTTINWLHKICTEVVHYSLFNVPMGHIGSKVVMELYEIWSPTSLILTLPGYQIESKHLIIIIVQEKVPFQKLGHVLHLYIYTPLPKQNAA